MVDTAHPTRTMWGMLLRGQRSHSPPPLSFIHGQTRNCCSTTSLLAPAPVTVIWFWPTSSTPSRLSFPPPPALRPEASRERHEGPRPPSCMWVHRGMAGSERRKSRQRVSAVSASGASATVRGGAAAGCCADNQQTVAVAAGSNSGTAGSQVRPVDKPRRYTCPRLRLGAACTLRTVKLPLCCMFLAPARRRAAQPRPVAAAVPHSNQIETLFAPNQ